MRSNGYLDPPADGGPVLPHIDVYIGAGVIQFIKTIEVSQVEWLDHRGLWLNPCAQVAVPGFA